MRINEIKQKISNNIYYVTNSQQIDYVNTYKKQLEIKCENINKDISKLSIMNTLKKIAIETEYAGIESTLETINLMLENILQHMFNEPISVKLKSHKLITTTKQNKPEINMTILYKNKEYNNICKLSSGGRARVSLSMTLALAKLNNCPFIIFDETLAYVGDEYKNAFVKTVKKELPYKTVICVQHDGTEGYFNQQITLEHST
jgi:DNA repair ATPase RecN